jgi:hypothetical protein
MRRNKLDESSAAELRRYLGSGPALEHLDLEDADLDDSEAAHVCSILCRNSTLTSLALAHNQLGMGVRSPSFSRVSDFAHVGEAIAAQLLSPGCRLKRLDLGWNSLRGPAAVATVEALGANRGLIELNLQYNPLGTQAVSLAFLP